jgi:general secretion pathway protein H
VFVLDVRNRTFKGPGGSGNLPETLTLTLVGAATERIDRDVGGIRFYADGSSTGGRVTVASGEREYRVGVDWLTGQVTVAE